MPKRPIRLIRRPEVQRRTSLPRSTLYALMKEGKFPKGYRSGPGQFSPVFWVESQVEEWINHQIKECQQ